MIHRPDQDRTDLDKALEYAFDELGLEDLTVLGATGGRLDHAVGNLGLLAKRALGERLVFVADDHRILAVRGELALDAEPGETWSFFTFDPGVRVSLEGVKWPIDRHRPRSRRQAVDLQRGGVGSGHGPRRRRSGGRCSRAGWQEF